jgi:hypothetical protein
LADVDGRVWAGRILRMLLARASGNPAPTKIAREKRGIKSLKLILKR